MKFATFVSLAAAFIAASVSSAPVKRDVDPNLVPQFGVTAGQNPTGTGDCDGINNAQGVPIKIPCTCPPDRTSFIAELNSNVAAGHVLNNPSVLLSFPTDNSQASQLARINAATVTLQNLHGAGVGCPASSTTFLAQAAAIQNGTPAPAPAPAAAAPPPPPPPAAAPAPAPAAGTPSAAQVAALAPDLGFSAGVNPTGTGDCDGAVKGANGQPIKIPCACPPSKDVFIAALTRDAQAGHAVNNPSVSVHFGTSNSNADLISRIQTSLVTLQNLNGPGQGCPAVSTTLSAQLAAAQAA
ncbi:hypothetical protein BC835DRAFT_653136 [Cytidiella melzeri]|nr:hypothetical protein BC835DRAFT_653136 [Cytidiella melzeri]